MVKNHWDGYLYLNLSQKYCHQQIPDNSLADPGKDRGCSTNNSVTYVLVNKVPKSNSEVVVKFKF